MKPRIKVDEWMAELRRLEVESRQGNYQPGGFSVLDVQRALGFEDRTIRRKMRDWYLAGLIEFAGKRECIAMDGRRAWTPVYRMKGRAKDAPRVRSSKRR